MLMNHIKRLKSGLAIEKPVYDFKTHTRSSEVILIEPQPVVIVEGILIFSEARILDLLDVRVFVDTPDDIRFIRRLQRDISQRGRTVESVIAQYYATVRPMHFEFVEPSKRHADLIIPEGGNQEVSIQFLCGLVREKLRNELNAEE
jgi:uridine kinase